MNSSGRFFSPLQPRLNLAGRLLRSCLCRSLHTNPVDQVAKKALATNRDSSSPPTFSSLECKPSNAPLSLLPLGFLLRSYLIASLSSSPRVLTPSLRLLSIVAYSSSRFLDPNKNPLLRYALKKTLYAHFCAGENLEEVRRKSCDLKALGYSGVILGHGREFVLNHDDMLKGDRGEFNLTLQEDVENWKRSNLETVRLVDEGGFVALKLTGAGLQTTHNLARRAPPSEQIDKALTEICNLAKGKGVSILIDAEHHSLQAGIDNWSLRLQKAFNSKGSKAIIYGTYQAYLRSTPKTLSEHLSLADREGFVLGVKLVRGAYLGSDPRHLFWGSKLETDDVYDDIASALLLGEYSDMVKRPGPNSQMHPFPPVNLLLATHNHASVLKALKIQLDLLKSGHEHIIELSYGQLAGMADEVGCELIMAGRTSGGMKPKAYKYLPWGSVGECMKYLVRRGDENRDALERTVEGRRALGEEIWRRIRG